MGSAGLVGSAGCCWVIVVSLAGVLWRFPYFPVPFSAFPRFLLFRFYLCSLALAFAWFQVFQVERASRSLAKTGFFIGSWRLFFSSLFSTSFLKGFFFHFGGVLEGFGRPTWLQKSSFCVFWRVSFSKPRFGSFFGYF